LSKMPLVSLAEGRSLGKAVSNPKKDMVANPKDGRFGVMSLQLCRS
jgi:hypothetical protein